MYGSIKQAGQMRCEGNKSKTEARIRESILKKAAQRRFKADRELTILKPRPILNRQDTI